MHEAADQVSHSSRMPRLVGGSFLSLHRRPPSDIIDVLAGQTMALNCCLIHSLSVVWAYADLYRHSGAA